MKSWNYPRISLLWWIFHHPWIRLLAPGWLALGWLAGWLADDDDDDDDDQVKVNLSCEKSLMGFWFWLNV